MQGSGTISGKHCIYTNSGKRVYTSTDGYPGVSTYGTGIAVNGVTLNNVIFSINNVLSTVPSNIVFGESKQRAIGVSASAPANTWLPYRSLDFAGIGATALVWHHE